MIRVGRRVYHPDGTFTDPQFDGFKKILVLTASSPYGSIGPYDLKDEDGRIMENIWQFSKVYSKVAKSKQVFSHYDKKVIWEHPAETHVDSQGNLTDAYWQWREKGMKNPYPVRYPVGVKDRYRCLYALAMEEDGTISEKLDYIESRKKIYLPVYCNLVKKEHQFIELKMMLDSGQDLLIIDVDGPHQESLDYY
jgi:hypothetical protein